MPTFKSFLLEYLTDEQKDRYKHLEVHPDARESTDHFFGKGIDKVEGSIGRGDKSEVHKAVERHLGHELSLHDYRTGSFVNERGNPMKITRRIKDKELLSHYNNDSTRKSKSSSDFTSSTHRGIEVMGQTNSTPDAKHPSGHAWGNESCKNVDNGSRRRYLEGEVRAGSVVHFVHDHDGKEIYRATLHPHHNDKGHTTYHVNSEYGMKDVEAFKKSARDAARKLSTPNAPSGIYKIHGDVYDDEGGGSKLHVNPSSSHEDLHRLIKKSDTDELALIASHHDLKDDHVEALIGNSRFHDHHTLMQNPVVHVKHAHNILSNDHASPWDKSSAVQHPGMTRGDLHNILSNEESHPRIREMALQNKNIDRSHVDYAMDDPHPSVVAKAAAHPMATDGRVAEALRHVNHTIRNAAAQNPNISKENAQHAYDHGDYATHGSLARNPATPENIMNRLAAHQDSDVAQGTMANPNASEKSIGIALDHNNRFVRSAAASHANASHANLMKALASDEGNDAVFAIKHQNITKEHLQAALGHPNARVRDVAQDRLNAGNHL